MHCVLCSIQCILRSVYHVFRSVLFVLRSMYYAFRIVYCVLYGVPRVSYVVHCGVCDAMFVLPSVCVAGYCVLCITYCALYNVY